MARHGPPDIIGGLIDHAKQAEALKAEVARAIPKVFAFDRMWAVLTEEERRVLKDEWIAEGAQWAMRLPD